jgi:hypothetical protein
MPVFTRILVVVTPLTAEEVKVPPEIVAVLMVPETVREVMLVVAKVEVPVTERVPEKEGELVTLIVPEEVEVETEILVPAKIL